MKILLIDNFDSFTFNLAHYFENENCTVDVVRNDQLENVNIDEFDKVVISPGPGLPENAGQLMLKLNEWHKKLPILGVCLGMQAFATLFNTELYNLTDVKHGVQTLCRKTQNKSVLFENLPKEFNVGHYHSWAIKETPPGWINTLLSEENIIMGIEHESLPLYAVQFHPESVLTDYGVEVIRNFIDC